MKIHILGCGGGIGGRRGGHTSTLMVDDDILVDCGTGVTSLSLEELTRIDHVFLTHAHLDHIACLPLMVDAVGDTRNSPVTVHGLEATLTALKAHIFNGTIWPDFTRIPSLQRPWMRFEPLVGGESVMLRGCRLTAVPVCHTIPAVAYQLDSGQASLVVSGDTGGSCPELWTALNKIENLRTLLIETSFPECDRALADLSGHLCPGLLAEGLERLRGTPDIYITHTKPGQTAQILREVQSRLPARRIQMLNDGQEFTL
ncbi:MAG: 3',5'-cyclic-nucleotide phosphodiesterase [Rhodocyclaceae bacterium]|nr:3',5'-cyclic-nucleotide phosphodiesterase [Rhodocyclaceae bacterium]